MLGSPSDCAGEGLTPGDAVVENRYAEARPNAAAIIAACWSGGAIKTSFLEAYADRRGVGGLLDIVQYSWSDHEDAIRGLVLPALEKKVHPGARAALWRLAEEAETFAAAQSWRRDWLSSWRPGSAALIWTALQAI